MACSTCPPAPRPKPTPPPAPPPLCEGSEACVELIKSTCVVYEGPALPQMEVVSGERLTGILKKIDDLLGLSGANVSLRGTTSVRISGTGAPTVPYRANVILDPRESNLLTLNAKGLLVHLGVAQVRNLLTLIKDTPELQTLFCSICAPPVPAPVCQSLILSAPSPATKDTTVNNTYLVTLFWTPPTPVSTVVDARELQLQSRPKYDVNATWTTQATLAKTLTQRLLDGFAVNTVFQFKLVNSCGEQSSADSNVVEACYVAPITVAALTTTPTTGSISFDFQGADTDSYEVSLHTSGGTLLTSTLLSLPLPSRVQHTFSSLTPETSYLVRVVSRVDGYRSTVFEDTFATSAVPCAPPTHVTVTVSS